jgi:hypothetical protein
MTETIDLVRIGCALLGLWGVLNAAIWLVDAPRWADGGALGWDLQRLRRGRLMRSDVVASLHSPRGLRALATALLLASLGLLILPLLPLTLALLAIVALSQLALSLRGGADGADKIALVTATGLFLQCAGLHTVLEGLFLAGVLWTGGQLAIAYFAAGASKAILAPWRNGQAVRGALTSYTAGHRWAAAALRNDRVALILGWTIILVEIAFPLALLAPLPVMLAALGSMFLLHLGIAVIMGLNTYPWAFLAAYPSALLLHQWINGTLQFF